MTLYSIGFEKYPSGENCPIDRIISTEGECKAVSVYLGLRYGGTRNLDLASKPAGCYWTNTESYFNTVVDTYQTSPESFGSRGGVCFKGKFGLVLEGKYLHQS